MLFITVLLGLFGRFERTIDAMHLRVRLPVDQARIAVAGIAADAFARWRVLIQHDAERCMKRPQPGSREVFTQLRDPWFMADGRVGIRAAGRRLRRIFATFAVNMIDPLGLGVIRLEVFIRDRPCGRDTAVMPDFTEVLLTESE